MRATGGGALAAARWTRTDAICMLRESVIFVVFFVVGCFVIVVLAVWSQCVPVFGIRPTQRHRHTHTRTYAALETAQRLRRKR